MRALNYERTGLIGVLVCIFTLMTLLNGAQAQSEAQKHGVNLKANGKEYAFSVKVPAGWSASTQQQFRNSYSIVDAGPDQQKKASASINIHVEPRLDHADVLKQIREFASVVPDNKKAFTTIGGYPAVQITQTQWRPQPSRGPKHEDPKVLRIMTYIAVNDTLIEVAANLPSKAEQGDIQKVQAILSSLEFETTADSAETANDLKSIQQPVDYFGPPPGSSEADDVSMSSSVAMFGASEGENARIDAAGRGELEVAVSPDGRNVVAALQSRRFVSSNDGGATFPNSGTIGQGNGDPSVAYGQSGSFYIAWIDSNCGTAYSTFNLGALPAQPFGYDCTGMSRSTNNGVSFQTNTVNPAVVCIGRAPTGGVDPAGACFPDQEHIAADRVNAGTGGGANDQIYSTWRNFNAANQDAGLVCSQDSGVNWTAPITLGGNSFFPRITVGQDGFVYVAAFGGGFNRLWKFSSCANGLALQPGFPVNVAAQTPYDCPFAGHDRCDQNPSSQTVAVDDTNPNHLYYAYAQDAAAAGSDSTIFVRDSLDGGLTWPAGRVVQANAAVNARRVMPWLCTTGGDAAVTWYEQRNPTPSDSTDHVGGQVGLDGLGNLTAKANFVISEVPDNWCDSGWPCGTRFAGGDTNTDNAAESCPNQPQLAGSCGDNIANTPDSGLPCDFSDEAAAPGTIVRSRLLVRATTSFAYPATVVRSMGIITGTLASAESYSQHGLLRRLHRVCRDPLHQRIRAFSLTLSTLKAWGSPLSRCLVPSALAIPA